MRADIRKMTCEEEASPFQLIQNHFCLCDISVGDVSSRYGEIVFLIRRNDRRRICAVDSGRIVLYFAYQHFKSRNTGRNTQSNERRAQNNGIARKYFLTNAITEMIVNVAE